MENGFKGRCAVYFIYTIVAAKCRFVVVTMRFFLVFLIGAVFVRADEITQNVAGICVSFCDCTENSDIYNLNCTDTGLKHVLAEWPTKNKTLRATFSYNKLGSLGLLPPSDAEVEVVFSHCSIKYIDQRVFENIPKIKFVDLSHNLLTSEELDSTVFAGLYNNTDNGYEVLMIKHLDLSYNDIHTLNKDLFEHLIALEDLNLEGNNFRVLDHSTQLALSSVKTLRKLNLANNALTELIGMAIDGLQNLVELDLSNNKLDFVPFTLVNISGSLEKLILSGNPIFEITDETFVGMSNIMELTLNNMYLLKDVYPNAFSPLKKLQKLHLCGNTLLENLDEQVFEEHPENLLEVYLNNNSFVDINHRLLEWEKLRIIQFKDNPLECSCSLFEIKKKLSPLITRELDGPRCMDRYISKSRAVYSLTSDLCDDIRTEHLRIETVEKNFSILKITVITIAVILTLSALIVSIVAYLRFQKRWRDSHYPFTTEVRYNPVNLNQSVH